MYNTLKDDMEMARNGFRRPGITEAIENAKDIVEKVENLFKEVWLWNMFFLQTYKATTWLIFLFFLNLPFLTTLRYPTPLNQIML